MSTITLEHDTCFIVGLDASECSHRALDFAVEQARELNARLALVCVVEWSPHSFQTPEDNEERHARRAQEIASAHKHVIDPALEQLKTLGIRSDGQIQHGNVAEVLNRLAAEEGASQIIVGRLGNSRLRSLVFGSVPCKLVQAASVPVTVVP